MDGLPGSGGRRDRRGEGAVRRGAARADPAVTRIVEGNTESFVLASWGWTSASPVVTVLAPGTGDDPPVAVAFLTGFAEEQADPDTMRIQRLPQQDDPSRPEVAGSVA
jgi:hypothetical protein